MPMDETMASEIPWLRKFKVDVGGQAGMRKDGPIRPPSKCWLFDELPREI